MALSSYTVYVLSTGQIVRTGVCPENDLLLQAIFPGEAVLAETGDSTGSYVVDKEIVPRPTSGLVNLTLAVGVDLVIHSLPETTKVIVDDEDLGELGDDLLTISFPSTGIWKLELVCPFPWISTSCEVTVI